MNDAARNRWSTRSLRTLAGAFVILLAGLATADDEAVERWKTWRGDLDHLYEQIEKPSSLKQIFKLKGIEWRTARKAADKRFKALAVAARKRRRADERADQVAFYGVLRYVVSQLRDSHASVVVDEEISKALAKVEPRSFEAGIELLPGTHGTILVSNTFAARGSNSPLYGRGVRHEATILESVNGVPAAEYFAEKAREKFEDSGGQSTIGRAHVEALNGLSMAEGESLKLVFKTLKASDRELQEYVELDPKQRKRAFSRLKWKAKKTSLQASECAQTRNPRNFVFMALKLPELSETGDRGVRYGRLPSGCGYVAYRSVSGDSRRALDAACAALADCPGLVLDMRLNGGGGERGIGAFDRQGGTWDGPVAVLIGPKAMSAAETELWSLLELREGKRCNARLFGRTTAGSSGDKIRWELPSGFARGRFVYRHWHGGRSMIEGTGIEPDEVVDQDIVELSLGIDSCIRRAEEWLGEQ